MRYFFVTLLSFTLLLWGIVSASPSPAAAPSRHLSSTPPVVKNQVVMELPYHGSSDEPLASTASLAMFSDNGVTCVGRLLGSDWNGNLFFSDPMSSHYCLLKKISPAGAYAESWQPLPTSQINCFTATHSGLIWIGLGDSDNPYAGLPIVVFRSGKRTPLIDWREELPEGLTHQIQLALRSLHIGQHSDWRLDDLSSGNGHVIIRAWSLGEQSIGKDPVPISLWVDVSEAGIPVYSVKTAKRNSDYLGNEAAGLQVDPDGKFSNIRANVGVDGKWDKLWIWHGSGNPSAPLINRSVTPEPWLHAEKQLDDWAHDFHLDAPSPPLLRTDSRGRRYLIWERPDSDYHNRLFPINHQTISAPDSAGEHALIVLGTKNQFLGVLGWTVATFDTGANWVEPIPDGRGFYRIKYLPSKVVIYFHPLAK